MEKGRNQTATGKAAEKNPDRIVSRRVLVLLPDTAPDEAAIGMIAVDFCPESNTLLLARLLPDPRNAAEIPHYQLLDDLRNNERFVFEMRKRFEKNSFSNLVTLPITINDSPRELEALVQDHDIQCIIGFEDDKSDLLKRTGLGHSGEKTFGERTLHIKIYKST